MKILKNDIVQVISGIGRKQGDKPALTGKVLTVDTQTGRIVVEGVRRVWKHLRRSQQHPHGARIKKEAPIDASNVRVICQSCNKPTKITIKRMEEGGRIRLCRKCRQSVRLEG